MTNKDRAAAARRQRKAARAQALSNQIEAVRQQEYASGFEKGRAMGARQERARVLECAGDHYKNGRDVEAGAIRSLHRALEAGIAMIVNPAKPA